MAPGRIWRHLLMNSILVRRSFPAHALEAIRAATERAEQTHRGEIRFVVEAELTWQQLLGGVTPRQRALEVFSLLRVWDTEENNGVMIYVMLADRRVEIVADRGIHAHVGADGWRDVCALIETEFRAGRFEAGAVKGIEAIAAALVERFPSDGKKANELPDAPVVM